MNISELERLKPSPDNPVRIECFDKAFAGSNKVIYVTGLNKSYMLVTNNSNIDTAVLIGYLKHYVSIPHELTLEGDQ